jgi:hypothetical protein
MGKQSFQEEESTQVRPDSIGPEIKGFYLVDKLKFTASPSDWKLERTFGLVLGISGLYTIKSWGL